MSTYTTLDIEDVSNVQNHVSVLDTNIRDYIQSRQLYLYSVSDTRLGHVYRHMWLNSTISILFKLLSVSVSYPVSIVYVSAPYMI